MNLFFWRAVRRKLLLALALILSSWLLFFSNTKSLFAMNEIDLHDSNLPIIEFLRVSVPSSEKDAWLHAEKQSWEPWLKKQNGFLGRQLFWDPQKQEGLLLISWASRSEWKSIPQDEIDNVQELFQEIAMDLTGNNVENPFPLKFEGELFPQ